MENDRRQFTRLRIPEQAVAFAEDGRRLGLVTEAGGGGMAITLDQDVASESFQTGMHMRVTVIEPHKDIRNTFRVELRYVCGKVLGLAFVACKAAHQ